MTPRSLRYNRELAAPRRDAEISQDSLSSTSAVMSTPAAREKQTPEEAVRAANHRFYAAFESLNMAEMESVWAHDDKVECVQPGWDLLLGWEEVRERWARIFKNTKRVRVALSGLWIRVEGNVGWVACTARVTTAFAEGFDEATVQATNIFLQSEGRWLLVAHHASPLPTAPRSTVQ
jgi:ketosteroid isomerase-like protein